MIFGEICFYVFHVSHTLSVTKYIKYMKPTPIKTIYTKGGPSMNEPKMCSMGDARMCRMDRCAWFHLEYHEDGDYTEGVCAIIRIADRLSKGQRREAGR